MPTQAANPMLFLPPHAPVSLPTAGTVLIGRSNNADVRIPDIDTSRHHAEILCDDGRCVIRDLESTNGTWINGKRVEAPHELHGGDRIEIGETVITFCEINGLESQAGDDGAQTHLAERPVSTQVFTGELAEIPPFAVVQILEMGRKTGVLCLETDGGPGKLWFQQGDPIHAETKEQLGFDAALTLVNATSGRFTFQPQLDSPETTIQATVTQLLLEASRLLDEASLLDE
jgi:pSer/pThr/pTyr-binding forkhead associated (FHA) protein